MSHTPTVHAFSTLQGLKCVHNLSAVSDVRWSQPGEGELKLII